MPAEASAAAWKQHYDKLDQIARSVRQDLAPRLALLATAVFLRIDGYTLDLTDDEAFDLTMSVAAGQLDADGIQKRLRLAQAPP